MDPNVVETLAIVTAEYESTMTHAKSLKQQMDQLEAKLHPEPVKTPSAKVADAKVADAKAKKQ